MGSAVLRFARVPLVVAVFAALLVRQPLAQTQLNPHPGLWPAYPCAAPASLLASGYAQPAGASSSFGMWGVPVSISPQGSAGVNIVNLGASMSFAGFGRGYAPQGFAAGVFGLPVFSGGSLLSTLVISGLNLPAGGGSLGAGAVSVNLSNAALNSDFFFGSSLARGYNQSRG